MKALICAIFGHKPRGPKVQPTFIGKQHAILGWGATPGSGYRGELWELWICGRCHAAVWVEIKP